MLQGDLQWHIDQSAANADAAKKKLELICEHHPGAKTLLDIGCGIGITMRAAQDLGLEVQGVEPNPHAVKYAKENMSYDLVQGYFQSSMFSSKFDVVILDMVLEHVPEPRKLVKDIFDVLKPRGILFLSVPDRIGGPLRILYSIINQNGYKSLFPDNDVHINHFSRRSIEALVRPNNGIVVRQPNPGTFIIRYEP